MSEKDFYSLPLMITVREMCKALRIGKNKGYAMIKAGTIFSIKYGNSIRIPRCEIEKILFAPKSEK